MAWNLNDNVNTYIIDIYRISPTFSGCSVKMVFLTLGTIKCLTQIMSKDQVAFDFSEIQYFVSLSFHVFFCFICFDGMKFAIDDCYRFDSMFNFQLIRRVNRLAYYFLWDYNLCHIHTRILLIHFQIIRFMRTT